MFTIFGVTHTLTQETIVLCVALGAFVLGIVLISLDVARRNRRRIEAESRPIDTSRFQQTQQASPPEEDPTPETAGDAAPDEPADDATHVVDETITGPAAGTPAPPPAEEAPEPEPAFISPAFTAPTFATARPILVCDGYGAGFGPKLVLTNMSFAVPDQGITTIMGPANSGRSTLLRALGGVLGQSGLFH